MKILEQYAELKVQEKELKKKIEALQPKIIEHVTAKGEKSLKTDFGKFNVTERSTWKYTEAVDKQKAKLVKLQEKEQATGVAEKTVKQSLTFTIPKPEK